jgi:pilus assembly protein CpaE
VSTPWIVLDVPHVWSGWTRRTLIAADDVILVASPDLANLRNAKNLVDALKAARPNDHPPRLVLNGVGMPKRPEIAASEFAKTVEAKPVAIIPHDAKLFGGAANNGQMIAEVDPKGKVAQTFEGLARLVAGWEAPSKSKRGFLDPLIATLSRGRG